MRETKDVRILVVEDEPLLRMAISLDFKRRGFQVFEAVGGHEAYDLLSQTPVDIVLSDIRMPGGDGIELLERIKAKDPEKPVVLLMTGQMDLSIEEALAKGADTVFPKPFDRKALASVMQQVIAPKRQDWSRRQFQRVLTDFDVLLRYSGLNQTIHGQVKNISRGGMFVAPQLSLSPPPVGSRIHFKMSFNVKTPQTLEGHGLVRHVADGEDGDGGFGVDFEDMSAAFTSSLLQLINDIKTTNFFSKKLSELK